MSMTSSFIYSLMVLLRYRQRNAIAFRDEIATPDHPARLTPAEAPVTIRKKFETTFQEVSGHRVFTLASRKDPESRVALFFHGGAYIRKAISYHWSFAGRWLDRFGGTVVFPDYPLAPEHTCLETLHFAEEFYLKFAGSAEPERTILMGDSAGGGLSLALLQLIRDKGHPAPAHTILYSPWIDLVMDDPDIERLLRTDPLLPADGLRLAAKAFAGSLALDDPRVSPIYGNQEGLGSLSLFTGTREILLPDARRFRDLCASRGIPLNYFEYPGMIHDWMILPLPESVRVLDDIERIID
jgi:acetyl esterase/lipase